MDDMKSFLDEHVNEIVILDFQHMFSCSDSDHRTIIKRIESTFGAKLLEQSKEIPSLKEMQVSTYRLLRYNLKSMQSIKKTSRKVPRDLFPMNLLLWSKRQQLPVPKCQGPAEEPLTSEYEVIERPETPGSFRIKGNAKNVPSHLRRYRVNETLVLD